MAKTGVNGGFAAAPNGADAIIDLIAAIPTAYLGRASFMMNKSTQAAVRKLKDSNGAAIWTASIAAGAPATLMGYPVILADDMPAIATDSLAIAFGDFSTYTIAERTGTRLLRDPYTSKGNVIFHVFKRIGGALGTPDGIALMQFSV